MVNIKPRIVFSNSTIQANRSSSAGSSLAPFAILTTKLGRIIIIRIGDPLSVWNCRMSMWNRIVSRRRVSAARRGVWRLWCLAVGVSSCRRVTAIECGRRGEIAALNSAAIPLSTAENSAAARLGQTHPGP
jgi:hypothetical protein